MCQGQQESASLGYSPMPINLVRGQLHPDRQDPGSATSRTSTSRAATTRPSRPPAPTCWPQTAPYPPACDKQGPTQCTTGTGGAAKVSTPVSPAAPGPARQGTAKSTGGGRRRRRRSRRGRSCGVGGTGRTAAERHRARSHGHRRSGAVRPSARRRAIGDRPDALAGIWEWPRAGRRPRPSMVAGRAGRCWRLILVPGPVIACRAQEAEPVTAAPRTRRSSSRSPVGAARSRWPACWWRWSPVAVVPVSQPACGGHRAARPDRGDRHRPAVHAARP